MAIFSIFFNDNPVHTAVFKSGVVSIGRDESNDLYIDSLAFAPAHAAVTLHTTESIIKQLNADFPLIINGERRRSHHLKNDDIITIGKHRIVYNPTETTPPASQAIFKQRTKNQQHQNLPGQPEASLQIMAGKHIGRIVQLKKI
ncbi:hypothetical protein AU255_07050 [Methyloprofundus sedimenti]|uniref:FHA domain-containing protein n=1 Tax=Methyloprofundus sedimenti TaxID=1420851 RepID=A0A1V8M7T9_9GAMM|nr:FHA domain-containing protein [Methyloprofundus sedimenti]OQK17617.1 hypothetical protein AU255_07050 [Methyloprofundus sedimenti]